MMYWRCLLLLLVGVAAALAAQPRGNQYEPGGKQRFDTSVSVAFLPVLHRSFITFLRLSTEVLTYKQTKQIMIMKEQLFQRTNTFQMFLLVLTST